MEAKENILIKIKSKYILNNIFDYQIDYFFKYKLLKYSKALQSKFEFGKIEYKKIFPLIKYKMISPENVIKNKDKFLENLSKEEKYLLKEIMNKIILSSYDDQMKEFLEKEPDSYFIINDEKMVDLFIENSICINNIKLEIKLTEKLLNSKDFMLYMDKIQDNPIFINFISNDIDNCTEKLDKIKISKLPRIGLDFPYYNNLSPNNILEFSYNGNISSNDFKIINNFQNLTRLKLINNLEECEALINFKNLLFLSIQNCPSAEIIIESEEISKNIKYLELDDGEILKFKFNNEPTKNKINFCNLEYLYFQYDIIDFDKSKNIKKLKEDKIELISSKMDFYLNLLLNCRKIKAIDLNVYQITKINQNQLNLFYEVFKSLCLNSLTISSAFENDIVFNLIQSQNISKFCKNMKLYITDLGILDYIIKNYMNLETLEINIEEKIAKYRINTPNNDTIRILNDKLYQKYETFKPHNNWLKICENQKGRIKKLILNNSNFQIIQQNIYCYSFSMLVELRLKNIPINTNTLPLFKSKSTNIYFPSLKIFIIRIMRYIDSFYQLEFKRKTLLNNLGNLENPFNINMNLIENKAIENFAKNIDKIPNVQHLVLNFMLPGIKKDILKKMLDKILDLKFLINLDFSINSTDEQKPIKNNQLMKLFPKLKQSKILLCSKLNICADI